MMLLHRKKVCAYVFISPNYVLICIAQHFSLCTEPQAARYVSLVFIRSTSIISFTTGVIIVFKVNDLKSAN